jgi:hypothetical protein
MHVTQTSLFAPATSTISDPHCYKISFDNGVKNATRLLEKLVQCNVFTTHFADTFTSFRFGLFPNVN